MHFTLSWNLLILLKSSYQISRCLNSKSKQNSRHANGGHRIAQRWQFSPSKYATACDESCGARPEGGMSRPERPSCKRGLGYWEEGTGCRRSLPLPISFDTGRCGPVLSGNGSAVTTNIGEDDTLHWPMRVFREGRGGCPNRRKFCSGLNSLNSFLPKPHTGTEP